jgi:ABC-type transport system involved in multi-copper enzyme maturation permease subunit
MRNIGIMTMSTIREAMSKKVFLFFIGISLIVLLIQTLIFSLSKTNLMVQGAGITESIAMLEIMIISPLSGLCLLLSIFSCSSFIPSMLEKGNIDLLLSKPVSRTELLLGKYFGGLLVVLINILFLILGVWFIIGVKFGYWNIAFLYSSLLITFTFAVLYSIIVLFGVITQGSMSGMMAAYFIFIVLSPLLHLAKYKGAEFITNETLRAVIDWFYYIVPKTQELMGETLVNLTTKNTIANYQPIASSFVFLLVMLVFSVLIFRKKDF